MRVFLVILLLSGCRPATVNMAVDMPLEVAPTVLDFGNIYIGQSVMRSVSLRNTGVVSRPSHFTVEAPFSAAAPESVTGGDEVSVMVTATPLTPGPYMASVAIDGTTVTLRGTALAIPVCAAPQACETTHFDLALEQCVRERATDGTACSTACVANGVCTAGICRGHAASCDDGNSCTIDGCADDGQCVHAPIECAEPADPCQAAFCDARLGCQTAPVEDGVRCGPDDCARNQARVCINGTCTTRTRPIGELCFETLAGVPGGPARIDARGDEGRFLRMRLATTDRWGNTWVVDGQEVRRVTAGGVVSTVVKWSGDTAPTDGVGRGSVGRASLATTDAFGNVYIADADWACVRKVTPAGVLSTVAGSCSSTIPPPSSSAAVVTSDGRILVAQRGVIAEYRPDGGIWTQFVGTGPLSETPGGAVLFTRVPPDAGELKVMQRERNGEQRVVRSAVPSFEGQPLSVTSVSPSGRLLGHLDLDGGCALVVTEPDGGVAAFSQLTLACRYSSPNTSTLTGSPVLRWWMGRDEQAYVFERGALLSRVGSSQLVPLAGGLERPGSTDGFGADAGLRVTAGLNLIRVVPDAMQVLSNGRVVFGDSAGLLRAWSDDAGITTLDGGPLSVWSIQVADGGAWVKSAQMRRWLGMNDSVLAEPSHVYAPNLPSWSPIYDSEAFDDSTGTWLLAGQLMMRLDSAGLAQAVIRSTSPTVRDGPLPDTNLDGGWVDTDAGTADFVWLRAPTPMSADSAAVLDRHTVRLLSPSGLLTLAGSPTAFGFVDGPAAQARFNGPLGLSRAPNGDLYIADTENNAIRVLTPAGQVRTVGRLTDRPSAVAVAPNGDVYVLVRNALLRGR